MAQSHNRVTMGAAMPGCKLDRTPFLSDTVRRMNEPLLEALELALAGQWEAAHAIVQQDDSGTAAWIHAVLHKIEGDLGNSRYWYRRAGKLEHLADDPREELAQIKQQS